ncbi:LOW QUALITY PROTEIN: hypothetical protein Cgig2_032935 [Carnegiea gigantea]|uniref:Uncharacterized protein n=1 Tax=Carnegiea gigantea TaxID=171969 RepID=A0A9Q1Q5C5_9CARY|nr:LOW QUALITY PROTEIN: hypothetical protein Cgig2_032935 [Carnegiea gigantea]
MKAKNRRKGKQGEYAPPTSATITSSSVILIGFGVPEMAKSHDLASSSLVAESAAKKFPSCARALARVSSTVCETAWTISRVPTTPSGWGESRSLISVVLSLQTLVPSRNAYYGLLVVWYQRGCLRWGGRVSFMTQRIQHTKTRRMKLIPSWPPYSLGEPFPPRGDA